VFDRLLTMCGEPFVVFAAVELVLNQRLLRRLCRACNGCGCDACLRTGFAGRIPVLEWVKVDEAMRTDLRARGPEVIRPATPLAAAARGLVAGGVTNEAELGRILGP
jgi:type II secretory ATPase GspE/PulE/Tfp pilus assembly ATPase PilB-like protein